MNRRRPERLRLPPPKQPVRWRLPKPIPAVVVGGGLAGAAAATVLAERGARVTLLEREPHLGGRVGAWTETAAGGQRFEMDRGFHGFFRQYYNLRALLRRFDPELSMLRPLEDYPVLAPGGQTQSFRALPRTTPWNVVELTRRTDALSLRDLGRVDVREALSMLAFDPRRTYDRHDHRTAKQYLDALRFPTRARRLLFDVFAHSFFNPEEHMSAAELLMMFHFYFTGNPEGLVFDVVHRPFSHALWEPMAGYLADRNVEVQCGTSALQLVRTGRMGWRVVTDRGELDAMLVAVAMPVAALHRLMDASPDLTASRSLRDSVASLATTRRFAVLRLWLDRPTRPGRAPFAGTTECGMLDNISLYHLFEDESRRWAEAHGGAVIELHAYAVPDDVDDRAVRTDLVDGLRRMVPETREARVVHERMLIRRDCPAFEPGSWQRRPGVGTPLPGLALAGDFVRLPFPSALMERAAASGFLAANHLLAAHGIEPEPLWSVPRRGLLPGGLA